MKTKLLLCGLFLLGLIVHGGSISYATDLVDLNTVTRFEYAQQIQEYTCQSCLPVSNVLKQKYTSSRFDEFKKNIGLNIDDIQFEKSEYLGQDYYYCVAGVIESGMMKGFPRTDSEDCGQFCDCKGKFCGNKPITLSEVITSLYSLVRGSVYELYQADREQVEEWMVTNKNSVPLFDIATARKANSECLEETNVCQIRSAEELDAFLRYCASNLGSCQFQTFTDLSQGNVSTAYGNILLKHSLLSSQQLNEYRRSDSLPGEVISLVMSAIGDLVTCSQVDDTDRDGINNDLDVCPEQYDPYQHDMDDDGIGDVCDDDVDGDGVSNHRGVVDFSGRLNTRLVILSDDNCVITPNEGQEDSDNNDRGDACSTLSTSPGFVIEGSPRIGSAPLAVTFSQSPSGTDQTVWNFGDDSQVRGLNPVYEYTKPGTYTVTAQSSGIGNIVRSSTLQVTVLSSPDQQVGYQITGEPLFHQGVGSTTFSAEYEGAVQQAVWVRGSDVKDGPVDDDAEIDFKTAGTYYIESQAYSDQGDRVGLSQATVEVGSANESVGGSRLEVSNLTPEIGEKLTFNTILDGVALEDISEILWTFGDGDERTSQGLELEKTYDLSRSFTIGQRIIFKDATREIHENIVTVYVIEDEDQPLITLDAQPLSVGVGTPITFSLGVQNLYKSDIERVDRIWGDGEIDTVYSFDKQTHTYAFMGYKTVSVVVTLKNGKSLYGQLTVGVGGGGGDICTNPPVGDFCDLDGDWTRDLCDDDIDGDGIPNRLGLLLTENRPSCTITNDNIDINAFRDYTNRIIDGDDLDNCFINLNAQQDDDNDNGVGNVCETVNGEHCSDGIDNDGDSNIDCSDGDCRESPSCIVGGKKESQCADKTDNDGDGDVDCDDSDCKDKPECKGTVPPPKVPPSDKGPIVDSGKCTQCPCPSADYSSALRKGDRIRAILYDESGAILYRYTQPKIIQVDVPDAMLGQ